MMALNPAINTALKDIGSNIGLMHGLLEAMDNDRFNAVPFAGSWTMGQLVRHITRSLDAVAEAMAKETEPIGRDPEQWLEEIGRTFLSQTNRFDAPDFLVPGPGPSDRATALKELDDAFQKLRKNTDPKVMGQAVHHFPGGPYSKRELLHLAMVHLQRHVRQFHRILDALGN